MNEFFISIPPTSNRWGEFREELKSITGCDIEVIDSYYRRMLTPGGLLPVTILKVRVK